METQYQRHKEYFKEYMRLYRNTPKWKKYAKQYYKKNRSHILKHNTEYCNKHMKQHIETVKRYYKRNREKCLQYARWYYRLVKKRKLHETQTKTNKETQS
jgi:hypothetical protein